MKVKIILPLTICFAFTFLTAPAQTASPSDKALMRAYGEKMVSQYLSFFERTMLEPRNLPKLKTKKLAAEDLEFRVWMDYSKYGRAAFLIEHINGTWRGIHINGYSQNFLTFQPLSPQNGWSKLLEDLELQGLKTLPTMFELDNFEIGNDGYHFLVEVKQGENYRIYYYGSPNLQTLDEAKKMVKIVDILHQELDIQKPGY